MVSRFSGLGYIVLGLKAWGFRIDSFTFRALGVRASGLGLRA